MPTPATTPACSTSRKEPGRHEDPTNSRWHSTWTTNCSAKFCAVSTTPNAISILRFFRRHPGQVYEQFLGKIIRLTPPPREVDDKRSQESGGVYYTPTYIVDYIVRQTVGKLLEENGGNSSNVLPASRRKFLIPVLSARCRQHVATPSSTASRNSASSTPPAAPARFSLARINSCWIGICNFTWPTTRSSGPKAETGARAVR